MFFFFPEKMKSARETIIWPFFLFFSRVENIFLAHFYLNFLGHSEVFSDRFPDFLSGLEFFSRVEFLEFLGTFWILTGKILIFFSGKDIFFSGWILLFFSRAHFFFSGCFQDFFLGQFQNFSGRILKIFSGSIFFFRGRK